jgi:hypothetical protein
MAAKSDDAMARFCASVVGSIVAETVTLPTDVAKTRLQLQSNTKPKYNGLIGCMMTTAKEEGFAALWKGYYPALIRQVCYSSLALVIYEPIRNAFCEADKEATFLQRLMAGGTAGAISITIFNPTGMNLAATNELRSC